jgi:hypothetical protein
MVEPGHRPAEQQARERAHWQAGPGTARAPLWVRLPLQLGIRPRSEHYRADFGCVEPVCAMREWVRVARTSKPQFRYSPGTSPTSPKASSFSDSRSDAAKADLRLPRHDDHPQSRRWRARSRALCRPPAGGPRRLAEGHRRTGGTDGLQTRRWRKQSRANPSLKPNSLLAGKIQGILLSRPPVSG